MIQGIAFSAYPIADMARSRQFYEDILGLTPADNFGDHWQEYTLRESTFALVVVTEQAPDCFQNTRSTTIAFEVDDLEATLETLKQKGVSPVYGPAAFPACKMAVINDPDNNVITLHQLARPQASKA